MFMAAKVFWSWHHFYSTFSPLSSRSTFALSNTLRLNPCLGTQTGDVSALSLYLKPQHGRHHVKYIPTSPHQKKELCQITLDKVLGTFNHP